MNTKNEIVLFVKQSTMLGLLLIFAIAILSNPAYAKTSSEWAADGNLHYNNRVILTIVFMLLGSVIIITQSVPRARSKGTWNNKGNMHSNKGRYEEAIEAYDKAIAINPDFAIAWGNKGNALNNLGRYEEAIKALDKAIAIDPNDAIGKNADKLVEDIKYVVTTHVLEVTQPF